MEDHGAALAHGEPEEEEIEEESNALPGEREVVSTHVLAEAVQRIRLTNDQ